MSAACVVDIVRDVSIRWCADVPLPRPVVEKVASSELDSEGVCTAGVAVTLNPLVREVKPCLVTTVDELPSVTPATSVVVCSALETPFKVGVLAVAGLPGPRVAEMTACEVLENSSKLLYAEFVVPVTAPLLQLLADASACRESGVQPFESLVPD